MALQREVHLFEALRNNGYRITQPRRAIVQALLDLGGSSSAWQVHIQAKEHYPSLGLVTVYRTLDLLAKLGLVRRVHSEDGCHGYVLARRGHHHHLICRQCGAAVEFEGCDLVAFFGWLSRQTGYNIEDHLLELVGVCSDCQQSSPGVSPRAS